MEKDGKVKEKNGRVIEAGCGRCKYYVHIRTPTWTGGLCKNPRSPHYGYIGKYGCLVEFCDMMELDDGENSKEGGNERGNRKRQ